MSLQTELYARLNGYSDLTDLVGTRIHPVRLPQNVALPAVSFQIISALRPSAFVSDTGDVRYRVQIDCWASALPGEANGADAVAAQVKAALKRWSGGNIGVIFLDSEQDGFEDRPEIYRVIMDFIIWFKE